MPKARVRKQMAREMQRRAPIKSAESDSESDSELETSCSESDNETTGESSNCTSESDSMSSESGDDSDTDLSSRDEELAALLLRHFKHYKNAGSEVRNRQFPNKILAADIYRIIFPDEPPLDRHGDLVAFGRRLSYLFKSLPQFKHVTHYRTHYIHLVPN